jgi:hypothetical protein
METVMTERFATRLMAAMMLLVVSIFFCVHYTDKSTQELIRTQITVDSIRIYRDSLVTSAINHFYDHADTFCVFENKILNSNDTLLGRIVRANSDTRRMIDLLNHDQRRDSR